MPVLDHGPWPPFLAAQLSNAVLATQAFQHDTDLLFSGMMPACGSANIPDCLFSALRYALARLSHRCSSAGYDEPAILSYAISSFCPTSADGLQGRCIFLQRRATRSTSPLNTRKPCSSRSQVASRGHASNNASCATSAEISLAPLSSSVSRSSMTTRRQGYSARRSAKPHSSTEH